MRKMRESNSLMPDGSEQKYRWQLANLGYA